MKLICHANCSIENWQPASYVILNIDREIAQVFLQRIWDWWRLQQQPGHENLSEIRYFEGRCEFLVPYDLDTLPQLAALVHARETCGFSRNNTWECQSLCDQLNSGDGPWLRLPDELTFENTTEPPDEDVILWTEGDRTEVWRQYIDFRARPKHADEWLYPGDSLSVELLQDIAAGRLGLNDPCVICLWDDQSDDKLCADCKEKYEIIVTD